MGNVITTVMLTVTDFSVFGLTVSAAVGRRCVAYRHHVSRRKRLSDWNFLPPDAVFQGQRHTGSWKATQDVSNVQKISGERIRNQTVAQTTTG